MRPWIGRARRRGQHGLRGGLLDASEMSAVGDDQYGGLLAGNGGESDLQPWRWACGGVEKMVVAGQEGTSAVRIRRL